MYYIEEATSIIGLYVVINNGKYEIIECQLQTTKDHDLDDLSTWSASKIPSITALLDDYFDRVERIFMMHSDIKKTDGVWFMGVRERDILSKQP